MRVVFAVNGDPNLPIERNAQLASARYRGLIPAREMNQRQIQAEVVTVYHLFHPNFDPSSIDLLVLHQPKYDFVMMQNTIGILMQRLEAIRRKGGVVIIDVSDYKFSDELRARLVQTIGEQKTAMYLLILKELFARCTAVTTPTENLAQLLRQALGDKKPIFLIDDMVEAARGAPRFAPGEMLNLLWFGQLVSHVPTIKQFVKADLPEIRKLRPTHLHILCEAVNTHDAVRFFGASLDELGITFGAWSLPALDAALAGCDIVVLPVATEELVAKGKSNNRALQALYAGRYAVAHPLDSFQKLADFIGIDASLPAAIAAALEHPDTVLDRIRRGQVHVEQHYMPAQIAERWIDICRQLAGKQIPASAN